MRRPRRKTILRIAGLAVVGSLGVGVPLYLSSNDDDATCDPMTLEWSVIELSETEAFERPMIAAEGLLEACGESLPPIYRSHFERTADPGARYALAETEPPSEADLEQAKVMWLNACPEAVVLDVTKDLHSEIEHRELTYRHCGVEALGLMDEDEFVRHDHVPAVSMLGWLLDQGVEEDIARILIRESMIRGYRRVPVVPTDVTTLPRSTSSGALVDGPAVALSSTAMSVGGTDLAAIEDGRMVFAEEQAGLTGVLVHLGDQNVSHALSGQPYRSHLTIVPDQSVTVGALGSVMAAGQSLGYTDHHIVGVQPEVRFPDLGMVGLHVRLPPNLDGEESEEVLDSTEPEVMMSVPEFVIEAGTPLHWVDGRPAGHAVTEHRLPAPPRMMNGRACFQRGGVWLCVDPLPANLG